MLENARANFKNLEKIAENLKQCGLLKDILFIFSFTLNGADKLNFSNHKNDLKF